VFLLVDRLDSRQRLRLLDRGVMRRVLGDVGPGAVGVLDPLPHRASSMKFGGATEHQGAVLGGAGSGRVRPWLSDEAVVGRVELGGGLRIRLSQQVADLPELLQGGAPVARLGYDGVLHGSPPRCGIRPARSATSGMRRRARPTPRAGWCRCRWGTRTCRAP